MRRDANVHVRKFIHQRGRSLLRLFDRLAKRRRCIIRIHPRAREDEANAAIGCGANGFLRVRVSGSVQVKKLGHRRDSGCEHLVERKPKRPIHVFRRELPHHFVERVAAPALERQIVSPPAHQDLICVAMTADKPGNDGNVAVVRAKLRIRKARGEFCERPGCANPPAFDCEDEVTAFVAVDERTRTAHDGRHCSSAPFRYTAAARLPPNCQPNSSGDSSCSATKSAGEPVRSVPASAWSERAAAIVTPYSASAADSPKSFRPKYATVCKLKHGDVPGL